MKINRKLIVPIGYFMIEEIFTFSATSVVNFLYKH